MKTIPCHVGYRFQRVCKSKGGILFLWDTITGAPMPIGVNGERWCIEHRPDGRGEPTTMHLTTWRSARKAFRSLAAGKPDEWQFWTVPKSEQVGQYVGQRGPLQLSAGLEQNTGVTLASSGLSACLIAAFPPERIAELLLQMCEATRHTESGPEPDWPTRKEGLKLMLAYQLGLPLKRVEEVVRHEQTNEGFISNLTTKPGYRHALRCLIDSMDEKQQERIRGLESSKRGNPAHDN